MILKRTHKCHCLCTDKKGTVAFNLVTTVQISVEKKMLIVLFQINLGSWCFQRLETSCIETFQSHLLQFFRRMLQHCFTVKLWKLCAGLSRQWLNFNLWVNFSFNFFILLLHTKGTFHLIFKPCRHAAAMVEDVLQPCTHIKARLFNFCWIAATVCHLWDNVEC